eukprot:CAMPEP_0180426520 /NCGR_PEP_ID=MMETSP1036_2-20121128/5839_1 /TAXON_ID=632150 /ORGANISM="Azadinium spinosum, Strain 3D9" /LENGTH=359 /DNA_ID=CAMNT_0022432079 /DNA_START=3 /DNA_END=1081 /DNA_ORIENTATION=+
MATFCLKQESGPDGASLAPLLSTGAAATPPLEEKTAEVADARQRASYVLRLCAAAPELLGDGREARPDRLLQVGAIHSLAPHLPVAAEYTPAKFIAGYALARVILVHGVPHDIQVVEVPGHVVIAYIAQNVVPEGDDLGHVCDALPHMDDDLLRERRLEVVEDLRPLHGTAALLDGNGRDTLHEVGIAAIGGEVVRREPSRHGRRAGPTTCVYLVTTQVQEALGEEPRRGTMRRGLAARHLGKEAFDEAEGRLRGQIQRHSASWRWTHLRVADAPALRMARHVEFHHHAHTPQAGVPLGVPLHGGIRSFPKPWAALGLKGEGLEIHNMPMQHVQLRVWQAINDPAHGCERQEVSARVDH